MELKFSRRVFLKSAAAAALAVSAAGLTACGSGDLVANAKGLNDTAELREIKMTVRSRMAMLRTVRSIWFRKC